MEQKPFPHAIIDNFLDEPTLDSFLIEFPEKESGVWRREVGICNKKLSITNLDFYTLSQYFLLSEFNNYKYLREFERISGIKGLVPDPYFCGGGFNCIECGGFLNIHADFNFHPIFNLYRKLNVLIFLNEDWNEEWGGHLELWDYSTRKCVKKISPILNRMVIFETSKKALHGHPKPLKCPENKCRKSIALYYYVKDTPPEDKEKHSTLYIDKK